MRRVRRVFVEIVVDRYAAHTHEIGYLLHRAADQEPATLVEYPDHLLFSLTRES